MDTDEKQQVELLLTLVSDVLHYWNTGLIHTQHLKEAGVFTPKIDQTFASLKEAEAKVKALLT